MRLIKKIEELNDELTIVDFFATWCGPCKMLSPVLEEASEELKVEMVKVDVDESLDLARLYNINSVPTIILFKNKEAIDKKVGYMDYDEIIEWVNSYK